ncbi:ALBU_BOMMX ame: Full=Serum albumin ame: Full= -serum ame: Full= -skin Flags: Precursor [Pelobates cultripes]|nr:ALBU_BOMMX ame: Full=Serum albumin ame: Full= -serum ame: Full= -skin Flags: Precursor [Pelobates cultripes]
MKWFILVCLIVGSTLIDSRNIIKRDAEHRTLVGIHKELGSEVFDAIVLIMLARNLQKCPLEEHAKIVAKISDFAKHCEQEHADEECKKPVNTLFYNSVCAIPDLATHYKWTEECCAKGDPDRVKCFHEHSHVELEPYKKPTSEELCKEFKADPKHIVQHYIHEVGRRFEDINPPAIIVLSQGYEGILTACCEAEDKDACLKEKMTEQHKVKLGLKYHHREICRIVNKYPVRTLRALKLSQISQKYPNANFATASKLTDEIVHLHQDCCHGDLLECMLERLELTEHTCEHHKELSSKLESCCKKPVLERTPCIIHQENDDVPADLPLLEKEFIDDPHVCEHFVKEQDVFLGRFLNEFSKRHQELSQIQNVRVAKGYQDILEKCCKESDPHECRKNAKTILDNAIKQSRDILEQNCGALEKLGDYQYQLILLTRYVQKIPVVTTPSLIEITTGMVEVGKKCCALDEKHRMPCADTGLSQIIGEMCERQEKTFINDNVAACCNGLYTERRACFIGLGPDTKYVPPPLDENIFHFDASLCTAAPEIILTQKKTLFTDFLKRKITLEADKITAASAEFTKIYEKCCAAEDHQVCFDTEKPLLIAKCKELVEH